MQGISRVAFVLIAMVAVVIIVGALTAAQERWLKRRMRRGGRCCGDCREWRHLEMDCGQCRRRGTRWAWDRACRRMKG